MLKKMLNFKEGGREKEEVLPPPIPKDL